MELSSFDPDKTDYLPGEVNYLLRSTAFNERNNALRAYGGFLTVRNCIMHAGQDVLYIDSGQSLYVDSTVIGGTGSIHGRGTAVFYNCSFFYNRENTTGAAGFGRPWRRYGQLAFINTDVSNVNIDSNVWGVMGGIEGNEVRFVEYNTIRDGVPVSTVGRPVNKNYPIGTVLTRWEALEFNPRNYTKGWDPLNFGEKLAKTDAALASVSIEIPDTAETTFPLPNSPEGVSFMWASNSPYIIIAEDLSAFTVTRPAQGEADIKGELTLYATNDENGLGDKRVFELVLLPVVK